MSIQLQNCRQNQQYLWTNGIIWRGICVTVRDAADNMDLYMIMAEYEQFYELKFARPPKMIVKKDGADGNFYTISKITVLYPVILDKALGRRNTTLPKLRTEKKEPQSQDSTTPGLPPRGVQAQGTGVKTKASSIYPYVNPRLILKVWEKQHHQTKTLKKMVMVKRKVDLKLQATEL